MGGIELRIVENCKNLKTSFLKIVKLAKSKDTQYLLYSVWIVIIVFVLYDNCICTLGYFMCTVFGIV